MAYKILVTGGREFDNRELARNALISLNWLIDDDIILAHGDAPGADMLAHKIGRFLGWKVLPYPANWKRDGNAMAGKIRNQFMLDDFKPNLVVAFPGGSGTFDMCQRAAKAGKHIWFVKNEDLTPDVARVSI